MVRNLVVGEIFIPCQIKDDNGNDEEQGSKNRFNCFMPGGIDKKDDQTVIKSGICYDQNALYNFFHSGAVLIAPDQDITQKNR